MKFDVYGRFQIEVRREGDRWVAYRSALGKRTSRPSGGVKIFSVSLSAGRSHGRP